MGKNKEYSKKFPFLPMEFDGDLEEYVYFGVLRYFDEVSNLLEKKLDIENLNFNAFKKVVKNSQSMNILKDKGILDENFIRGAQLYIKDRLKFDPKLKEKLGIMPEKFVNNFYKYAIRIFFDQYFYIYKACPLCGDVKDHMNFNEKDKRWYCPDCHKNLH
ncbi:MAG: hypothetical protein P8Y97_18925 [Candidatus Lokiarchaeota archaeon]